LDKNNIGCDEIACVPRHNRLSARVLIWTLSHRLLPLFDRRHNRLSARVLIWTLGKYAEMTQALTGHNRLSARVLIWTHITRHKNHD